MTLIEQINPAKIDSIFSTYRDNFGFRKEMVKKNTNLNGEKNGKEIVDLVKLLDMYEIKLPKSVYVKPIDQIHGFFPTEKHAVKFTPNLDDGTWTLLLIERTTGKLGESENINPDQFYRNTAPTYTKLLEGEQTEKTVKVLNEEDMLKYGDLIYDAYQTIAQKAISQQSPK